MTTFRAAYIETEKTAPVIMFLRIIYDHGRCRKRRSKARLLSIILYVKTAAMLHGKLVNISCHFFLGIDGVY